MHLDVVSKYQLFQVEFGLTILNAFRVLVQLDLLCFVKFLQFASDLMNKNLSFMHNVFGSCVGSSRK